MNIAIVEDNENLREAVKRYLELESFTVYEYGLLDDARQGLEKSSVDLIILDVMLPDGDGFMFAKKLKAIKDIPIIFLTARTDESDRVTGLEIGADDYVLKPFSTKELVLRVKAVLKRSGKTPNVEENISKYSFDNQFLDFFIEEHRIKLNNSEIMLTAAEWNILEYLSKKAPQVFSRNQLLDFCLGSIAEGSERTIDTHIKNLRHKLGNPNWIETIRGFGYRFNGVKCD